MLARIVLDASFDMLFTNTAWSLGAQLIRLFTALLLIALLDPAARGLQSLLILLPTLVSSLALLGVSTATPVLLHGATGRRYPAEVLLGNLLGLGLLTTAVLALALLPSLGWLARYSSGDYPVSRGDVLIGLLLLPPVLLGDYLRSLLIARRDLRMVALTHAVQALVQLILAVVLVLVLRSGPIGAVWAAVLGGWAGFVATLHAVRQVGALRPRFDRDVQRALLGLGLRGHAGNVVQTFNYRLDAVLVQGFLGQAAVGLYQTGVLLAETVWYLPNAVSSALLPEVASDRDSHATPRVVRHTLLLTVAAALALISVVWPALVLLRPAYRDAIPPLLVLLFGVVALGVHKVLSSDLAGRGLPQYPSITSALALVVTIVADLLLIPRLGIVGAAVASSLAYVTQTVALTMIYRRVTGTAWRDLLVPRRDDVFAYWRIFLRRRGWRPLQ